MRGVAIVFLALSALALPALARADVLVALQRGAPAPEHARPVAPQFGIWGVSARRARALRGVVARAADRRAEPLEARATDPLAPSEWWLAAVGADRAQPPATPGRPVVVVDTGVDVTQPDLAAMDVLLLNTQRITPRGGDEHHGTAVASIVGAPADGRGMVGVYPGAAVASWDVGGETLGEVIAGIAAAVQQPVPGVINVSVAFEGLAGAQLLQIAVDSAVAAGWLVVAAAGNGGERGSPPTYPADLPHVVTVGAADRNDNVPGFSNRSGWTDVVAPGVGVLAAVPLWRDPSGYAALTGTSFAAPIVSGAAAWVWTTRPALDAGQVAEVLRRSAADLYATGVDPASGWGRLDIPAALARQPPIRDPQEPNDDVPLVADGGTFGVGTKPLVRAKVHRTRVAARLLAKDDPTDVYRLFVPAGDEVVATLQPPRPSVRLALWGPRTATLREARELRRRDLIGTGSTVRTRAAGRKGAYYYLAATLQPGALDATYLVNVELRAAPSRPTTRPAA